MPALFCLSDWGILKGQVWIMINKYQHNDYGNKSLKPHRDSGICLDEGQLAEHTGKQSPSCLEQPSLPLSLAFLSLCLFPAAHGFTMADSLMTFQCHLFSPTAGTLLLKHFQAKHHLICTQSDTVKQASWGLGSKETSKACLPKSFWALSEGAEQGLGLPKGSVYIWLVTRSFIPLHPPDTQVTMVQDAGTSCSTERSQPMRLPHLPSLKPRWWPCLVISFTPPRMVTPPSP